MKDNAAVDTLLILSPPIRLIDWLEKVFAQKKAKGEEMPENFVKWLERWQRIRSDLLSEIDYIDAEVWSGIAQQINSNPQKAKDDHA